MTHAALRSVARDIADSLSGGVSFLTGSYFDLTLYEDAARSEHGLLSVDLLIGHVITGQPSADVVSAVQLVPAVFERLCRAKGVAPETCRAALVHFRATPTVRGFTLFIADAAGKVTEADYHGSPARRVLAIDPLGRVRKTPIRRL